MRRIFPGSCLSSNRNADWWGNLWGMESGNGVFQSSGFPGIWKEGSGNQRKNKAEWGHCNWKRNDSRPSGCCGRMWCPVYYEQHGPCCRRKGYTDGGAGNRGEAACDYFCMLWRCQNAGGNCISDADGENLGSSETPSWGRTAVYQCSDRSHNWRSDGKLCHAGRYYSGGARSFDWICRTPCHSADDWSEASGRLPESRISSGAWVCR